MLVASAVEWRPVRASRAIVQGAGLEHFALQAVKTEFVDQEEIEPCIFGDDPGRGPIGQGRRELLE